MTTDNASHFVFINTYNECQCFIVKHICRSHQPTLRPKPAKELAYPNALTEKYAAKMKDRISKDKNGQLVTRAKSKRAESGNLKGIATNKLCTKLTVLCFEMPASS